jgi:serine/threonine-protein kinase
LAVPGGLLSRSGSSANIPGLGNSETVINPAGKLLSLPASQHGSPSEFLRLFPPLQDSGTPHSIQDPANITLEHFRIEERIGSGGMGAVFRAVDERLERNVALKILAPGQAFDESAIKRFRNEARAAARLDHENIARVFYIGEDRGLHFIAFEFVTGSTIRDLIRQQQRLTPTDVVNYGLQVAYALMHTSAMGVVHRDIKPSNIIITPNGRAKLVDLGLARKDNAESQADLTLPGTTLGTFDYISPEQAKDPRSVDVRSDIYSLGCTMYHMLTGRPPYPEGTVLQKLLDHQGKEAPDAAAINPRVPDNLSAIIRRMMNSDRSRRHQTADQLVRDLTHAAGILNLRGVNPERLVWTASRNTSSRGWRGQTGLILTVAAFLLILGWLQKYPGELGRQLVGDPGHGARVVSPESPGTMIEPGTPIAAVQNAGPAGESPGNTVARGVSDDPGPAAVGIQSSGTGETLSPDIDPVRPNGNGVETPRIPTGPLDPETDIVGVDPRAGSEPGTTEPNVGPDPPGTGAVTGSETPIPPSAINPEPLLDASQFPVSLFSADANLVKPYRSLWAACAAAEDGSTIELAFTGPRTEKPFRITKENITIRAARGHRPVIEFTPGDSDSSDSDAWMINVQSGPLRIVNVQFVMFVPEDAPAQRYAVFGVSRPRQLEMNRVAVTVINPRHVPATIVDVTYEMVDMPADMGIPRPAQDRDVSIRMTDCLFRGAASLASLAWQGPLDLTVENCAVGLASDLIQFESASAASRANVLLRHVTARLEGSIIQLSGPVSADGPVLDCEARNCLFSCRDSNAAIYSDLSVAADDARRQLLWRGERNFYDSQSAFWQIENSQEVLDFEQWRAAWSSAREVGPNNVDIQWSDVIPTTGDAESDFASVERACFTLMSATVDAPNPAVSGATDGGDAGCQLTALPVLFTEPVEESPTEPPPAVDD